MPEKKRFKLSDAIAEVEAEHPGWELEADNGTVFVIPPPQLWNDAVLAASGDAVQGAQAILGKNYAAFVKAGGSAAFLMTFIQKRTGVSVGESPAS